MISRDGQGLLLLLESKQMADGQDRFRLLSLDVICSLYSNARRDGKGINLSQIATGNRNIRLANIRVWEQTWPLTTRLKELSDMDAVHADFAFRLQIWDRS